MELLVFHAKEQELTSCQSGGALADLSSSWHAQVSAGKELPGACVEDGLGRGQAGPPAGRLCKCQK